jgi:DNA-binding transcriptional regulator PaaX
MVDRIVFKYVEDRRGEISIAKAAAELGVSESELREALKRLVSKGLLAGEDKK